jgi:large subunit ribosomal protein L3
MINLVAKKVGMSHLYSESGSMTPLTILDLYDSCVVDIISDDNKPFNSAVIGYDKAKNAKKVNKSVSGVFLKKGLSVYKNIYATNIDKSSELKSGVKIDLSQFLSEGDKIDVSARSIGKGFAGVIKRHNFGGLEATHGVSISHRSHGSTGQCQDPGKVFKGKKMAGHMGNKRVTIKNLEIISVDRENGFIAVKGAVPGGKNSDVILKVS